MQTKFEANPSEQETREAITGYFKHQLESAKTEYDGLSTLVAKHTSQGSVANLAPEVTHRHQRLGKYASDLEKVISGMESGSQEGREVAIEILNSNKEAYQARMDKIKLKLGQGDLSNSMSGSEYSTYREGVVDEKHIKDLEEFILLSERKVRRATASFSEEALQKSNLEIRLNRTFVLVKT